MPLEEILTQLQHIFEHQFIRYAYTALKDRSNIRLLVLEPQRDDGTIHAGLAETSLENARKVGYQALSYTWGSANFSKHILIDGKPLLITENLFDVLEVFAKAQIGWIWIDAICIDQNDCVEKATQIPLMTDIYRSAEQVLVWLGKETGSTRTAFEWIPQLRAIVEGEERNLQRSDRCKEVLKIRNEAASVTELFENSWLERLWVLQEVVVARSVGFISGFLELHYDTLADFVFLLNSGRIAHECLLSDKARNGKQLLINIHEVRDNDYRSQYLTTSGDLEIIELIVSTRLRKCYDQRDRLFALAGLATDSSCLPYPANYEKDVGEVYTDFAIHRIASNDWSRILSCCYLSDDRIKGLPSWAPDWTCLPLSNFSEPPSPQGRRMFSASGKYSAAQKTPVLQPNHVPQTLIAKGVVIERIEILWHPPCIPDALLEEGTSQTIEKKWDIGYSLEQIFQFCGSLSKHRISWPVFWRTLISDTMGSGPDCRRAVDGDEIMVEMSIDMHIALWQVEECELRKALDPSFDAESYIEQQYGKATGDFKKSHQVVAVPKTRIPRFISQPTSKVRAKWRDVKSAAARHLLPRRELPATDALFSRENAYDSTFELTGVFHTVFEQRAFCITETGKIGWVADVSVSGDFIAILAGHDVPIVLRRCDIESDKVTGDANHMEAFYQVVGESYIHGVMDGQVVEGKDWKDFEQIRLI